MTALPVPMPADQDDGLAAARLFQVLGDPTRLRIVRLLLEGEHHVGSLVAALGGGSQSRVSNHLACLRWCGVVGTERRGRQVVYRVTDPGIGALVAAATALLDDERRQRLACCKRIGQAQTDL